MTHYSDDCCLPPGYFVKFQWHYSDDIGFRVISLLVYLSVVLFHVVDQFSDVLYAVTVHGTAVSHSSHCFGTDKEKWHVGQPLSVLDQKPDYRTSHPVDIGFGTSGMYASFRRMINWMSGFCSSICSATDDCDICPCIVPKVSCKTEWLIRDVLNMSSKIIDFYSIAQK